MTHSDQTESKLTAIRTAMEEKKADDITVIELKGKSLMADYFIICTAHSRPQMNAIVEAVREKFRDENLRKPTVEGLNDSRWILLDAGDVIGHVMAPEERAFYNLETFWTNAKPIAA